MISNDLQHSLSKILPVQQNLIPVCFKPKLAYSGSSIEEIVEKVKVQLYFIWFKKHNHLYKDLELDIIGVQAFINESLTIAKEFKKSTYSSEKYWKQD